MPEHDLHVFRDGRDCGAGGGERAVVLISFCVIVTAWQRIQPPWWDNAGDLREMQDNMATGAGYEGIEEYALGADSHSANDECNGDGRCCDKDGPRPEDARRVRSRPARAAIRVERWDAESHRLHGGDVRAGSAGAAAVSLSGVAGGSERARGGDGEQARQGQMLVPVEAGMNRVQVTFVRTWDRSAGGWISVLTVDSSVMVLDLVRRGRKSDLRRRTSAVRV